MKRTLKKCTLNWGTLFSQLSRCKKMLRINCIKTNQKYGHLFTQIWKDKRKNLDRQMKNEWVISRIFRIKKSLTKKHWKLCPQWPKRLMKITNSL